MTSTGLCSLNHLGKLKLSDVGPYLILEYNKEHRHYDVLSTISFNYFILHGKKYKAPGGPKMSLTPTQPTKIGHPAYEVQFT